MSKLSQTAREKFQELLRELFQIRDAAELDFGIYRIMGQKREVIERFIEEELLEAVSEGLGSGAVKRQADAVAKIEELAAQIRDLIGKDAIDAEGKLDANYAESNLGKQYLAAQEAAGTDVGATSLEASVFNHLYQFFSRYYDKGDFMSLRRYSKKEKYAIPYNGEEVHLHWANADQYYIKTGESFTDYRWKDVSGNVRVRFTVTKANVPKDNIKAPDKRFFIPQFEDVSVESVGKTKAQGKHLLVTVPFHFRGLTEAETKHWETYAKDHKIKNGNGSGGKLQQAILAHADDELPTVAAIKKNKDAVSTLMGERPGSEITNLTYHLRRFTAKNTSDYFIHKDLGGFLNRELDFYLKNEVLSLDAIEASGEERAEGWFQILQIIRLVGGKIIDFVAQIENFQKRIFEKKKFVTECHYCLTLDRVPEELYDEIAKNKAQIEEWKLLFTIDEAEGWSEPPTKDFLKENWNLVVDTGLFEEEFQIQLSSEIGKCNGLIINGENSSALALSEETYRGSIPCTYIDPPYNTEGDGFIYKDQYRSSSWLTMINQALAKAAVLVSENGSLAMSLDEGEHDKAKAVLKSIFGSENYITSVIWQKKYAPANDAKWFSEDHDYLLFAAKARENWYPKGLARTEKQDSGYKNPDNDPRGPWMSDNYTSNKNKEERPNSWYAVIQPNTQDEIWPSEDRVWAYAKEAHEINVKEDRIWWGKDGNNSTPRYKRFLSEVGDIRPRTIWKHDEVGHNQDGVRQNQDLFGLKSFQSPKPIQLIDRVIGLNEDGVVADFFAGSGTTAHASISRERCEEVEANYFLVEMGTHFSTVLVPRIKKVVYSADWKEGKPTTRNTGISHCFKYLRLESYEDALGNIAFGDKTQGTLNFDEYVINYMLAFETHESETLLNIEGLASPFDYKLEIREGDDTVVKKVDLPETFNFLIGLRVETRRVLHRKAGKQSIKYLVLRGRTNPHATGGEREVVVIWRTTKDWGLDDFSADKQFVLDEKLTDGADEIFVNHDSVIPGAKSLDPVFKRRMFNECE